MTSDEGAWCAVMPLVGAPVGAILAMLIVNKIGQKWTILLMAPITFSMFILLALAKTVFLICLARFIIGSVEGGLYTAVPMYLGEIADPSIRGALTASIGLAGIIGMLIINVLGFYYSIFVSSLICSAIPILHLLTFLWMPESPYYLIKKGKHDSAEKSLQILRGNNDVKDELKYLSEAVKRQENHNKGRIRDLFLIKSNCKGLLIFAILNLTKKFSGKNPLIFYTVTIFEAAEGSINANLSVIIYICVEIIVASSAFILLDWVGRRPVAIISTAGCAIALGISGIYFFLKDKTDVYMESFGWLPLTVLTTYNIFYTLGLELIPTIYLGELFPTNIKASALGIADIFSIINGTIASKLFQILHDNYGMFLPFWVFSGCCVVGLICILKFVPETKNKTLEEIQLDLINGTKKI